MVEFEYLAKGLYALSRAHRVNTMAGHLGAAVVAGYFIAEQHVDLDDEVYTGIESDLDRIIRGESVFSPKKKSAITAAEMFKPFPKEQPKENLIDGLADALKQNIDQMRQSGHNVIFTAIAIRALKDHPELATPSVTDGIRKLIAGFNGVTPGNGYYGKKKGRIDGRKITLKQDDAFPPYKNLPAMAVVVLNTLIQHAAERRQGFGGLTHIINHAAALAELANYGYKELATKGLAAHHQHLQYWKTLPDVTNELGKPTASKHDPRKAAYWKSDSAKPKRARAQVTHRVKTIYGYDTLLELVDDERRQKLGNEKFRYLM